jgi:hypothetical protein
VEWENYRRRRTSEPWDLTRSRWTADIFVTVVVVVVICCFLVGSEIFGGDKVVIADSSQDNFWDDTCDSENFVIASPHD